MPQHITEHLTSNTDTSHIAPGRSTRHNSFPSLLAKRQEAPTVCDSVKPNPIHTWHSWKTIPHLCVSWRLLCKSSAIVEVFEFVLLINFVIAFASCTACHMLPHPVIPLLLLGGRKAGRCQEVKEKHSQRWIIRLNLLQLHGANHRSLENQDGFVGLQKITLLRRCCSAQRLWRDAALTSLGTSAPSDPVGKGKTLGTHYKPSELWLLEGQWSCTAVSLPHKQSHDAYDN